MKNKTMSVVLEGSRQFVLGSPLKGDTVDNRGNIVPLGWIVGGYKVYQAQGRSQTTVILTMADMARV